MSSEDKFDADKVSEDLHERIHNRVHEDAQSQFRKARQGGVQLHLGARSGGLWPGLILVIIGAVVLLDHMGIISSERLWRFQIFPGMQPRVRSNSDVGRRSAAAE